MPSCLLLLADSQSVTSLLNRAGFALSTVDVDEIQIAYPSIYELIDDLKWMGEGNAVVNRRKTLNPETLFAAGEIYKGALSPEERSTAVPVLTLMDCSLQNCTGWRTARFRRLSRSCTW